MASAREGETQEQQQEEQMRKRVAVTFIAALLASAHPAVAQRETVVYTNVVDGQRIGSVVRVMRVVTPAIPVPPSIVTTPTFDCRQYIDDLRVKEADRKDCDPQCETRRTRQQPRRLAHRSAAPHPISGTVLAGL